MKLLLFLLLLIPKEYVGHGYLVSVDTGKLEIIKTMNPDEVNTIVKDNLNIEFDVEQVLDSVNSIEIRIEGKVDVYIENKEVYKKRNKLIYRDE